MIKTRLLVLAALCVAPMASAVGQQFPDIAGQLDRFDQMRAGRSAQQRVQVNYQIQVPADRGSSLDDQKAAITAVHTVLYDLVAHECEHLAAAFKSECRMSSASVGNMGMNYNSPVLTATANASFDLVPTAAAPDARKP